MKLFPIKFAIATGASFAVFYLVCNIFFAIAGDEIAAWTMAVIFHEMDVKSLRIESSFQFSHQLCGIGIMFLTGALIGFTIAIVYNSISKRKMKEEVQK